MFRNLSRKFVGNRFPSEIYSINSIQYHTNTRNVSRFNETFKSSLKANVNSLITSSSLCLQNRQFSISSSRNYCKDDEHEKSSKMFWPIEYDGDKLEIGLPSLLDVIGIWFKSFKIQSNYMPTFNRRQFLQGSTIAIECLTEKIAKGDFNGLRGLVTDELFDQIKEGFGALTSEERQKFIIKQDEIIRCGIKNIDIIEDDEGKSIEILVVCHAIKNWSNIDLSNLHESDPKDIFLNDNVYVLNYGFVKDVTDEDWTVNMMIHCKMADAVQEQTKILIKKLEEFSKKK